MSTAMTEAPQLTLKQHLASDAMKQQLAMVVPKHVTAERMVRVALTALTRNPKLAECTQASFFKCLLDCAQWGLETDGRRAHLIPFENKKKGIVECTLIIDYKGFAELAFRSGLVHTIHAQEVRTGDIFDYDRGEVKRHVPHFLRKDPGKPKDAGEIFAYYAIVQMAGDALKCEVMSVEEVNSIRDKSQGWTAFKKGWAKTSPWQDYPVEMGKKTVFKRASKWLPLSAEFRAAIDHDDTEYVERTQVAHSIDSIGNLLAADDEIPAIDNNVVDEGTRPEPQNSSPALFDQARDAIESAVDPMACKAAYDSWLPELEEGDQADLNTVYQAQLKTYPTSPPKKKGQGGLPLNP